MPSEQPDHERLVAQQREIQRRIARFRATDRLSGDELYERDSLRETLETLRDPDLMAQICEGRQAIADGAPGASLADVKADLDRRH